MPKWRRYHDQCQEDIGPTHHLEVRGCAGAEVCFAGNFTSSGTVIGLVRSNSVSHKMYSTHPNTYPSQKKHPRIQPAAAVLPFRHGLGLDDGPAVPEVDDELVAVLAGVAAAGKVHQEVVRAEVAWVDIDLALGYDGDVAAHVRMRQDQVRQAVLLVEGEPARGAVRGRGSRVGREEATCSWSGTGRARGRRRPT